MISESYPSDGRPYFGLVEIPWWELPESEDAIGATLARNLIETVQDIERRQSGIGDGNRRHAKIYAGYLPNGLVWGSSPSSNQRQPFEATKNVARGVCDTATSLIVKSRPKSSFVTDGADFEVQSQAEDMDQFMQGATDRAGLYAVAPRAFLDSTIFGTGGWKYVPRGEGDNFFVSTERVLMDDIIVDEDECREHLEPQNVYHRMVVRVDALIRKYANGDSPKDREIRSRLLAATNASWPTRYIAKGRCVLIEAIHCDPYGQSGNRRVLACEGVTLVDEPWHFDFQPYTWLWWSPPISGFYGDGVCYRQYGRQQRITYMYRWIQRVHDLFSTPRAWVDPSGGVPTMQMSNELGAIISARKPPTFQVQNSVPPEIYKWLDGLESGTFEDEGMAPQTGQGMLPPGIDSAPAQREWNFKETQKFAPVSQRWENAVGVEPAVKIIAMFKRHIETTKSKPKVTWANQKRMFTVKWPDLKADAYVIRAAASNHDSLAPAARVQSALELAQTGWITPSEGRALISHPDLKESDDLGNAGETYAKWALLKLRRGEQLAVDDKVDLAALDRVIRQGRALAITQEGPQSIIDGMARFLDELDIVQRNVEMAMQPPPQPTVPVPAMAPGPAQGMPMAFTAGPQQR